MGGCRARHKPAETSPEVPLQSTYTTHIDERAAGHAEEWMLHLGLRHSMNPKEWKSRDYAGGLQEWLQSKAESEGLVGIPDSPYCVLFPDYHLERRAGMGGAARAVRDGVPCVRGPMLLWHMLYCVFLSHETSRHLVPRYVCTPRKRGPQGKCTV